MRADAPHNLSLLDLSCPVIKACKGPAGALDSVEHAGLPLRHFKYVGKRSGANNVHHLEVVVKVVICIGEYLRV